MWGAQSTVGEGDALNLLGSRRGYDSASDFAVQSWALNSRLVGLFHKNSTKF